MLVFPRTLYFSRFVDRSRELHEVRIEARKTLRSTRSPPLWRQYLASRTVSLPWMCTRRNYWVKAAQVPARAAQRAVHIVQVAEREWDVVMRECTIMVLRMWSPLNRGGTEQTAGERMTRG